MSDIYVATKYEDDSPEMEQWGDTYVGLDLLEAVESLNNVCVASCSLTDAEILEYTTYGLKYPGKCYCGSAQMRASISYWKDGKHVSTIRLSSDDSGIFGGLS